MVIVDLLELAGVAHFPKAKQLIEQVLIQEGFKEAQTEFAEASSDQEAQERISQFRDLVSRNQVQGNERNIDYWRKQGWEKFSQFVSAKSEEQSKTQQKRSKSVGESVTLHEDPNWLVVIPTDKAASCYHGKYTDWCTTKPFQPYYERYVYKQNIVLVYFLQIDTGNKWAIACHTNTDAIELFDKQDKAITKQQFHQQTGFNPDEYRIKALEHPEAKQKIAASKQKYTEAIQFLQSKMPFTETSAEVEKAIMFTKEPDAALSYCREVKGRWPEWEKIIVRDPEAAHYYATVVIGGRWPEAEPHIMKEPYYAVKYAAGVVRGRWPEAEPTIAQSVYAVRYAEDVVGGRWKEAEDQLLTGKNLSHMITYAIDVIMDRWPEAEQVMTNKLESLSNARGVVRPTDKETQRFLHSLEEYDYTFDAGLLDRYTVINELPE